MERRTRVLVVLSSHMAHHPRYHYRLAAALQAAGHDVTFLAQPDLSPGAEDAVPVHYLPRREGRPARMASGPLTMLRALRLRPDVIHVGTLELLPWAVATKLLRRDLVVLYDSNEEYDTYMLIKEWLPERVRPLLQRLTRWLEPALATRLDAATTALPATQAKFADAGVRSTLVRNFPPALIAADATRTGACEHDILIGGSLPDDQMPILARTAAEIVARGRGDVRWLIAARNYGERERGLLEEALRAEGVRERFDLRFNVPFTEMRGLMDAARIGFVLYPGDVNYAARIPIRIFEYMAAGLPFVASDLPTTAEFCAGRGVAVLARAGDPVAYADELIALLDDEERRAEMTRRGPELVRAEYNWERESGKLLALYRTLLDERDGRRRTVAAATA